MMSTALGDLGPELESTDWLMVPTKYHQIYYQASADAEDVGRTLPRALLPGSKRVLRSET